METTQYAEFLSECYEGDGDNCPGCGEADMDRLIWQNDDDVVCMSCGLIYQQ